MKTICGLICAGSQLAPPKRVEAPLAGAKFVVPLDEIIGEAFKKYMATVMEARFRLWEMERRVFQRVILSRSVRVKFSPVRLW